MYFFNNIYVGSLANHIDILFGAFASYSLVPNSRERCSCKFWGKTPQDYLIIRREWPINECPLLILKNLNDFSAGVFYSTPYYQAQKSTFKLDVWFDTFATLTVYLLQCLTFATNINTYNVFCEKHCSLKFFKTIQHYFFIILILWMIYSFGFFDNFILFVRSVYFFLLFFYFNGSSNYRLVSFRKLSYLIF